MALDFSWLTNILPIFVFLFVFLIIYSILAKTNVLGGSSFVNALVSFIMGIIFLTVSSLNEYVANVLPWFVILIIVIFFILVLVGFSSIEVKEILKPGTVLVFIFVLIIILLLVGFNIFSGEFEPGGNPTLIAIKTFLSSSSVLGGISLLIIAAIVIWIVTKK